METSTDFCLCLIWVQLLLFIMLKISLFLMLNDFTVMLNLVWYTRSDLSNFNYFVLVSNLCFVSNFKESLYASLLVVDDKASFLLSIILWKYLDLMSMYLKDFDAFEFCVCVCFYSVLGNSMNLMISILLLLTLL